MFALAWLVARGGLAKEKLPECYASYVADLFRTVRFGTGEAHSRAEMMEFNFLVEQGAISREPSGRYAIDAGKMPAALARLSRELLEIEASGDRARAEAWFRKYDAMPPDLATSLKASTDVPVDIDPQIPFPRIRRARAARTAASPDHSGVIFAEASAGDQTAPHRGRGGIPRTVSPCRSSNCSLSGKKRRRVASSSHRGAGEGLPRDGRSRRKSSSRRRS